MLEENHFWKGCLKRRMNPHTLWITVTTIYDFLCPHFNHWRIKDSIRVKNTSRTQLYYTAVSLFHAHFSGTTPFLCCTVPSCLSNTCTLSMSCSMYTYTGSWTEASVQFISHFHSHFVSFCIIHAAKCSSQLPFRMSTFFTVGFEYCQCSLVDSSTIDWT